MNRNFKVIKVDHIAFATDSIDNSSNIFSKILGIENTPKEEVETENVNVLKFFNQEGVTSIELLEPIKNESVIGDFLNKNGRGLHHIALEVDSINNAIIFLKENKIKLVYDVPQIGSDNKMITFIHPKSSPGILIELCQKNNL
tara:strand:+ start:293 stop:721 length:429 start_codon:yes stop_codon:yes gene_type:complete